MKTMLLISVLFLMLFTAYSEIGLCQSQGKKSADVADPKVNNKTAALINGTRVITEKEVDEAAGSQLFALQEKIYSIRKKALETLVIQAVLEAEAKRRGVTDAELREQLVPSKVAVKQTDIDNTYANNLSTLENMNEDEAKQRIRLDMEARSKLEAYKSAVSEIINKARVENK